MYPPDDPTRPCRPKAGQGLVMMMMMMMMTMMEMMMVMMMTPVVERNVECFLGKLVVWQAWVSTESVWP